jgi:hypothetical protein
MASGLIDAKSPELPDSASPPRETGLSLKVGGGVGKKFEDKFEETLGRYCRRCKRAHKGACRVRVSR